jgi:acyl-CoA synthetase (AMP-forming)/AMP-acid ligase II
MGSSESPAQAVAVTSRNAHVASTLTFAAKAETIVVDDDLRPLPAGHDLVGRLATRGRVPVEYYKDPERSASTFVTIDGERYSLPGDQATVDADGTIHLVGRGSACINTGGEKVYPEEVEAVLLTHPAVEDVLVIAAPDAQYGSVVCALVVAAPAGAPATVEDLRAHCAGVLAGYKAPRRVITVDSVRRGPAGKPDYAWAAAIAADGQ